jgi:hypothetical protein
LFRWLFAVRGGAVASQDALGSFGAIRAEQREFNSIGGGQEEE